MSVTIVSGRAENRLAVVALAISMVACSSSPSGPSAAPSDGGGEEAPSSMGEASTAFDAASSDGGLEAAVDAGAREGAPSADAEVDGGASIDAGTASDGGDAAPLDRTCPPGPFGAPIPAGAVLARVSSVPPSDGFNHDRSDDTTVEGPVWTGQALLVSEFASGPNPPSSRILQVDSAGNVSVVFADSGSNGLAIDLTGTLYGAVHADGSLSRFDLAGGVRTPVAASYGGARFNSPNDLAIRSDGNLYFSDPTYQAPTPSPQSATRVYRVAAGTRAVSVVDATLTQPNGVTLSLDESTLYVSSTHGIYAYPVLADGSTGSGAPFAPGLDGDGMVLDCAGNLYVAVLGTGNLVVLGPTGTQIGQLSASGVGALTNLAFGGADRRTLYASAQGKGGQQGLFQVELAVPGMPY